jgi:Na+-driven multidrug efflux pump
MMMPIIGFQIVGSQFFQAIGKAKTALVLSMLRQLIVLIPMLIVLPRLIGLDGVWSAMPISDVVASIVTGLVLTHTVRRMDATQAPAVAVAERAAAAPGALIGERAGEGAAGD